MSSSKRTISFTVDSEAEKQLYIKMAKLQKMRSVSDLARIALHQYITRYKLYKRIAVQRHASEEEKKILAEFE